MNNTPGHRFEDVVRVVRDGLQAINERSGATDKGGFAQDGPKITFYMVAANPELAYDVSFMDTPGLSSAEPRTREVVARALHGDFVIPIVVVDAPEAGFLASSGTGDDRARVPIVGVLGGYCTRTRLPVA